MKLSYFFSVCSEVSTTVGGYPATGPRVVHPQLFLPLPRSNSPLYKVAVSTPTHLLQSVSEIFSLIFGFHHLLQILKIYNSYYAYYKLAVHKSRN